MRCATNEVNANPIDLHINDNLLPDLDVTVYFSIQPWTPYFFLCLSSIILCGSFSSFPLQNIQELLLGLNDSQVCLCVRVCDAICANECFLFAISIFLLLIVLNLPKWIKIYIHWEISRHVCMHEWVSQLVYAADRKQLLKLIL